MIRAKKGFTLVELLAVIVILAIIMIIATQSVGKTVTRSRTQAFDETMQLAAKNAKRILQTDGTLNAELLKNSLNYSTNEYDFSVSPASDGGYVVSIISNTTGKFKNVNFDEITQNTNWKYWEDFGGTSGKNIISFKIDSAGELKKIDDDSDDEKIATGSFKDGCTEFTKKDTYDVGDVISFCNKNKGYENSEGVYIKGKSEDFYVISDNGDTVTALARYNLMVGDKATDDYAIAFKGLQSNNTDTYPVAFANKDENNISSAGIPLGYWTDVDHATPRSNTTNMGLPLEAYGTGYPADVYDNNSLLHEPVQTYQAYFTSTLNKPTTKMRLITYNELVGLNCNVQNNTCKTDAVTTNKREWVYSTWYWSGSASGFCDVWYVGANGRFNGRNFFDGYNVGVRPVITINKSEI